MKQTAVEFLIQQIVDRQNGIANGSSLDEIFQQALELEEQQIKEAYVDGFKECEKSHEEAFFIQDLSDDYYSETYKNETE